VKLLGVLLSRTTRSLAYGALAVGFAQALASRGLSPLGIGSFITVALLAGAVTSALTGRLVRGFGTRVTMAASGVAMIAAAALLAGDERTALLACLLGVVSPGAQDVGPFAAIEQVTLAEGGPGRRAGCRGTTSPARPASP
jgi:MFS family permease